MKYILLSATLAALLALPASAQVTVPEVHDYSGYTGNILYGKLERPVRIAVPAQRLP